MAIKLLNDALLKTALPDSNQSKTWCQIMNFVAKLFRKI